MSSLPRISVGIPTYRRPAMLAQAVRSAIASLGELPNWEILIGDDDPEGTPLEEFMDDDRVVWIRRTVGLGCVENMNDLLSRARGEFFTWLQDDDLLAPDYLEKSVRLLQTNNEVAWCQGRYLTFIDGDAAGVFSDRTISEATIIPGVEFADRAFRDISPCMAYTGVYRTEVLRITGGIPRFQAERQPLTAEYLITLKHAFLGPAAWFDQPVVAWRVQGGKPHEQSDQIDEWINQIKNAISHACVFLKQHPPAESRELRRSLFIKLGDIVYHKVQFQPTNERLARAWNLVRGPYPLGVMDRLRMSGHTLAKFINREWWTCYMKLLTGFKRLFSGNNRPS